MHNTIVSLVLAAMLGLLAAGAGAAPGDPRVRLETSAGPITLELSATRAPATVRNFLSYVKAGFYDGTIFHRVIPGFMIQGGGFTPAMRQKPTQAPIRNESDNGLGNTRGSIAMARTNDPHSATAQFFINLVDNPFLDHGAQGAGAWGYAVFGKVAEGMGAVDEISGVKTGASGTYRDVPLTPVVIESARVLNPEEQ